MARPPSDIAQRIVTAATERFLNDGVDGASLRQIARAALQPPPGEPGTGPDGGAP